MIGTESRMSTIAAMAWRFSGVEDIISEFVPCGLAGSAVILIGLVKSSSGIFSRDSITFWRW